MNAAVLHALGKPPRFEQFPEPIAGEGEVIVHVRAAALKPVDKQMASGSHYASPRELPVVCGIDGVGSLDDGARAFFGGPRRPYGAMAERTVLRRAQCFPVPDGLSDDIAAGRNEQVLSTLRDLGADATIQIDKRGQDLTEAFTCEAGDTGFQVVIDYLWGRPTEALLAALTRNEFAVAGSETRLVQVGESAGATISLPAAALRSTPLTIVGTAGMPSLDILTEALKQVMAQGANGKLRIDTERVPLADIENAWQREQRSRLVVIP
jgi:NADPH:quinone reductase-like Zn-dependent oxidoreductase